MRLVHASTFSGIGAPEIAADMLGWTNAFHCEINPFGRSVLDYYYPNAKSYEDITKTDFSEWGGQIDVLTGGFPCFVAGTKVLTMDKGFVSIEDISIGDYVLSADKSYHRVISIMNHNANELCDLRWQGLHKPVICTPNHPFLVMRKSVGSFNAPEWIDAKDINKGDRIAFPIADYNGTHYSKHLCRLIGMWLADGWLQTSKRKGNHGCNNKVIICSSIKNLPRLVSAIQNAGYRFTLSIEHNLAKCIICSKSLVGILSEFGKYAYGKHLSPQCFSLSKDLKSELIKGWLNDGYTCKNGISIITTVSEQLAVDMAQIARDAYCVSVSISKKTTSRKCVIEGRKVSERPQYCVTIPKYNRYATYEDGYVWVNVKHKSEIRNEFQKVYNLEVEGDHTYNVYGIAVHNCQPFSNAGKRRGAEDDRYLWPYMLKCIQQVRPTWFIGENVAGITTMVFPGKDAKVGSGGTVFEETDYMERNERFIVEEICQQLEDIGYSVQPMLIPACAVGAPHRRDRIFFIAHRNAADTDIEQCDGLLRNAREQRTLRDEREDGKDVSCERHWMDLHSDTCRTCESESSSDTEHNRLQHGIERGAETTQNGTACGRRENMHSELHASTETDGSGRTSSDTNSWRAERRSDNGEQCNKRNERQSSKNTQQGDTGYKQGRDEKNTDNRTSSDTDLQRHEERNLSEIAGEEKRLYSKADTYWRNTESNDGTSTNNNNKDVQANCNERSNCIADWQTSGRNCGVCCEHDAADTDIRPVNNSKSGIGESCESRISEFGKCHGKGITDIEGLLPENRWRAFPTVSAVYRGNDGLPFNVDDLTIPFSRWKRESLKAYGNAIVVQVMYEIFRAIDEVESNNATL